MHLRFIPKGKIPKKLRIIVNNKNIITMPQRTQSWRCPKGHCEQCQKAYFTTRKTYFSDYDFFQSQK